MHDELWAGAELKLEHAHFHFEVMQRSLSPDRATETYAALDAMGMAPGSAWQRNFYPHLDAFLSATHSVPEIIQCCFGHDSSGQMKRWFANLDIEEQNRRREFSRQFDQDYVAFRALPLGEARHIIEHRSGIAPVEVAIVGRFGVTHVGGPAKLLPDSEMPAINPELPLVARASPLQPHWSGFTIQGRQLFEACLDYLNRAQKLIGEARLVSARVHGNQVLTAPI